MIGYAYGDNEPTKQCPYCGFDCTADFVDIGVGFQQCGPFHCTNCEASEIGPNDEARELSDAEKKTDWYEPNTPPGSSANVIGGTLVSHVQAKAAYQREFTGNPLWNDKAYVAAWWKKHRNRQMERVNV